MTPKGHELGARVVVAMGRASECVREWGVRGEGRKLGHAVLAEATKGG
jgi:hypothetical protein